LRWASLRPGIFGVDGLWRGEDRRALLAAIGALKYFLDLGEQEIATILCISRRAVASTASRALTTLARQFREES
jgi:DNA-directed RNA polymerase specialized sigma24 family protein